MEALRETTEAVQPGDSGGAASGVKDTPLTGLLEACRRVADGEKTLRRALDKAWPGWHREYLFDEMFAQVRSAIEDAETRTVSGLYRRWDCSCGTEETVILWWGERPTQLPDCYDWPPSSCRCDCGGILNRVEADPDSPREAATVPAPAEAVASGVPSSPWVICRDPEWRGATLHITDAAGGVVCESIPDEGTAALLLAAPDLLEALKAVVSVADRKTDEFDLAHAAIAKAEGRNHA